MACLLFCFSDEPIEGDERYDRPNMFNIGMIDAPTREPLCCLYGCIFPCCAFYQLREKALDGDLSNYRCCQGYYDRGPCKSGSCGEEQCPALCLCIEAWWCSSCSISATRMFVMDNYFLQSDPMDRRLIRFNNALQCLSCICNVLAAFDRNLRDLAQCIDCIAHIVYYSTAGCMNAQVNHELEFRKAPSLMKPNEQEGHVLGGGGGDYQPPQADKIDRADV
mmetsp:Transcript_37201/g.64918  ORF Transcript_37201/g.64918 Transcript_37201/m.64918 type:complete len:221 (-) Transcript_37201:271-933(-)